MKIDTKSLNLLLVEDDIEVRTNLEKSLEYVFGKIYVASDGKEALKIQQSKDIDLIISDYMLPTMNAYEYISQIRKKDKDLPIIILSNYFDVETLHNCIPLNLIQFLEKPVSFSKLKEQIDLCMKGLNNSQNIQLSDHLIFNKSRSVLFKNKKPIPLTFMESKFIELLSTHPKNVFLYNEIIQYINEEREYISKDTIKNIVYRLRKKIEDKLIRSHRNLGYSLL